MAKEDNKVVMEGIVVKALPNAMFKVQITEQYEVTAQASGKMRMNSIKIMVGDPVTVEVSPYDLTRGRITFRGQKKKKDNKKDESTTDQEESESSD